MLRLLPLLAQNAVPGADAFIKAVDQADKASDRWLFLATVILLIGFCYFVIRYLIKDRETARVENTTNLKEAYAQADLARKDHTATMKEMYGAQTKLSAELLVALQENNEALNRVGLLLSKLESK